MHSSNIIHFCIPADGFTKKYSIKPGQIIILHDSVMATSETISTKFFNGKASVIHMLMNEASTVVIDSASPNQQNVIQHMRSLGMLPKIMTIIEHDRIMSRSQAPLAVLTALLKEDLEMWQSEMLLTTSGEVLLETLRARSSTWTESTVRSLLQNPQIIHLIDDMTVLISGK